MPALPRWLTVLQHTRELRRDASLQSLAQALQSAASVQDASLQIASAIAQLRDSQKPSRGQRRIDPQRLRELRVERDELQAQSQELCALKLEIEARVQHAQSVVAQKESDLEVLRRLETRLRDEQQQTERRREEQSLLESVSSLCNAGSAD